MDQDINTQDKMAQEIQKRRDDAESEVLKEVHRILKKPIENLTQQEKGFLQARRHVLSRAETQEYTDVLAENLLGETDPLYNLTRKELNQMALDINIEKPEKLPNIQAVIDAIKQAQQ